MGFSCCRVHLVARRGLEWTGEPRGRETRRRTLLRQSVEVEVGEMRKQSHAEDLPLLAGEGVAGGKGSRWSGSFPGHRPLGFNPLEGALPPPSAF